MSDDQFASTTATGSTLRQFADSGMQPSAGSRPTPKMPKPLASRLLMQTKTRAPQWVPTMGLAMVSVGDSHPVDTRRNTMTTPIRIHGAPHE
jgi:hypothetical protein